MQSVPPRQHRGAPAASKMAARSRSTNLASGGLQLRAVKAALVGLAVPADKLFSLAMVSLST